MRRNLRARRGFTVSEALVAVAILSLMGLALAAGIPTALHVYRSVTASAEASLLCGTLTTAISDELHFASAPAEDGTFNSAVYGRDVSIRAEGGRVLVGETPLLSEQTYTGGLEADVDVKYGGGLFQVDLTITGDGTELSAASFAVSPLNP